MPLEGLSAPPRCPYLAGADGAWVSEAASTEHRCTAVFPPAPLAVAKQRRLCLTTEHVTCATYVAAREARTGLRGRSTEAHPAWGWVRTTPVVHTSLGRGALVAGLLADRRGWQVVPAVALVAALGALGIANIGSNSASNRPSTPASFVAVASPTVPATIPPLSPSPEITPEVTVAPVPTPSAAATSSPGAPTARATYTVKSGDTLYGIARQFGISVAALKDFNGLTTNVIRAGLVLRIP